MEEFNYTEITLHLDGLQEFGRNGWKQFTMKIDKTYADEENVFHRLCKYPSEDMVRKAVAYYRVCYCESRIDSIIRGYLRSVHQRNLTQFSKAYMKLLQLRE